MNAEQMLNKIKVALGYEVKLEQLPLEDGMTIVEAEKFEPEFSIGIVTPEGQAVPAPVGEYMLEDGRKVIVLVEGIISEVLPAEEAAIEPPAVEAPVAAEEAAAPVAKKVVESVSKETFYAEIEALKKENLELKAQIEAKAEVVEEVKEEVKEVELEEVKPIKHNPEKTSAPLLVYGNKGVKDTLSRVMEKINNL